MRLLFGQFCWDELILLPAQESPLARLNPVIQLPFINMDIIIINMKYNTPFPPRHQSLGSDAPLWAQMPLPPQKLWK